MKTGITAITLSIVILLAACKKDKDVITFPTPAVLSVKLDPQYLNTEQVDSAFAIWHTSGHDQRIKMDLRNDSLITEMELFKEGSGQLTIHIFSNKKYSNQYFGQWAFEKTVTLSKTKAITYQGPSSFYDASWLPRVELSDAIGHEAVIALRPDDPYFIVNDPGHNITKLTVDRSYWKTVGGIALAGRDIWECTQNCTGVANDDFFRTLPGRIGTKPWNHISIVILFEINANGEGWVLSLEHEP